MQVVEVVKMEKEVLRSTFEVDQKGFVSMDKRHCKMLGLGNRHTTLED